MSEAGSHFHRLLGRSGFSSVYIKLICSSRIRKTRCDGAKPVCFNCRKRPPEVGECSYDSQPKRRGQDKAPGTRVRTSSSHKSKRRRTSSGTDDEDGDSGSESSSHRSPSPICGSTGGPRQPDPQLHATYDNFPGLSSEGVCIFHLLLRNCILASFLSYV